jgi:two-component sensor histidine kinase
VVLRAEVGQALAMVLHELATNAAKYGALSAQQGSVQVRWRCKAANEPGNGAASGPENGPASGPGNGPGNGPGGVLVLDWVESGGPAVTAPLRSGYGTSTIRHLIPYEFGGTVALDLAPEGARCRLEIPGALVSEGTDRPRPRRPGAAPEPDQREAADHAAADPV